MNKSSAIKALSIVVAAVGMYVSDKQQKIEIEEAVERKFAEREQTQAPARKSPQRLTTIKPRRDPFAKPNSVA